MPDLPTTISEPSAPAVAIRQAAQRGMTALSLYAPGRANADSVRSLIMDLLTLAHVRGWDQPSPSTL